MLHDSIYIISRIGRSIDRKMIGGFQELGEGETRVTDILLGRGGDTIFLN